MFPEFNIAEGATLILLGLPIGAVGAVVGVGGGFLLVPALLFLFPDADHGAVAVISLTAVLFNAFSASVGYRRKRLQDFRTARILIALAVPGAVAGALLNNATDRAVFETVFGAVLIAGAIYLVARSALESRPYAPALKGSPRAITDSGGARYEYRVNERMTAAVAPWAGLAAGFFGIGGGIINVPFMMLALRIPKAIAVPTSQLDLTVAAATALVVHFALGEGGGGVWREALVTGIGALAGAQIGVRLAPRVGGRVVLGVIGVGLFLGGARLLSSNLV